MTHRSFKSHKKLHNQNEISKMSQALLGKKREEEEQYYTFCRDLCEECRKMLFPITMPITKLIDSEMSIDKYK